MRFENTTHRVFGTLTSTDTIASLRQLARSLSSLAAISVSVSACCFGGGSEEAAAAVGEGGGAAGGPQATQISATLSHACAAMSDGHAQCWGQNGFGELGNGTTTASPTTGVIVAGLTDVVEVATTLGASCARTRAGHVHCWGRASSGILGSDRAVDARTPVRVPGIEDAIDLDIDGVRAAAAMSSGAVVGWGRNELGGFGWPDWVASAVQPMGVAFVPGVTAIDVSNAGVGILAGTARTVVVGLTPLCDVPRAGLSAFNASAHGCFEVGGSWQCCGGNQSGALGVASPTAAMAPLPFPRAGARSLVTQGGTTWSVGSDGTVACAGDCVFAAIPAGLSGVDQIAPGETHHCARIGGTVRCWGEQMEAIGTTAWHGDSPITFATGAAPTAALEADPAAIPGIAVAGAPRHTSPVEPIDAIAVEAGTPLQVGQVVAARWNRQAFYQARVVEAQGDGRVRVLYESGERGTLARSELRLGRVDLVPEGRTSVDGATPPETPMAAGTVVWVRDGRYWFRARVTSDDGHQTHVRFSGYAEDDRRGFARGVVRLDG